MTTDREKLNALLFRTLELSALNGDCRSVTDRAAKLMLQGADPFSHNKAGKTAFEVAVDHERMSALTIMIKLANDLERHKAQKPGGLKALIDDVYTQNGYTRNK